MAVKVKHKSNKNRVEIEVTSFCNQKCFSCNRLCSEAPTKECVSIDQIKRFLYESSLLRKKWHSIVLMGGEPLLHKEIDEIFNLVLEYKRYNPKTQIKLVTNGTVKKDIPEQIVVMRSVKECSFQPDFGNVLLAPIDRIKGAISTCKITSTCGIALTPHGIFPCGCGASVARVAGFDIGIPSLLNVTWKRLREQLKQLCQYCGRNLEYEVKCSEDKSISPFWKETLAKYKKEVPCLSQY